MTRLLLTFGIALAIASQASAAITTYSGRASFDAATTNQTIVDFNGISGSFQYKGASFSDSGINFSDNSATMFIIDDFYSPQYASPYLNENTADGEITVTPGAGITALAVDLGTLDATFQVSTQIDVLVTTASGSQGFSISAPGQPDLGFFGFTSDSDIISVSFSADMLVLDNVTVAQAADTGAVPEPATLTIWGLGALGCAVAAYRRKRKQAA